MQDDEEQEEQYHGPCALCRTGIWGDDWVILDWGGRAHNECAKEY